MKQQNYFYLSILFMLSEFFFIYIVYVNTIMFIGGSSYRLPYLILKVSIALALWSVYTLYFFRGKWKKMNHDVRFLVLSYIIIPFFQLIYFLFCSTKVLFELLTVGLVFIGPIFVVLYISLIIKLVRIFIYGSKN